MYVCMYVSRAFITMGGTDDIGALLFVGGDVCHIKCAKKNHDRASIAIQKIYLFVYYISRSRFSRKVDYSQR